MHKLVYKTGVIALTSVMIASTAVTTAFAAQSSSSDTIDELWGKPTVVYGGGLSDDNVNEVANTFGVTRSNTKELFTTGDDVSKYLGTGSVDTSSLVSCVKVEKKSSGNGVNVEIATPENITRVTETQYANAAITAGVSDVNIEVASLTKATGESALTGVYMALEANGETVDTKRSEVAQSELETTNEIAQNNANNSNFNTNDLDQALIDIKTELAELKQKQGETASADQVKEIVENALAKYNLDDILSQDDINKLIEFAKKYQSTSAIDSKEVLNQLKSLSGNISEFLSSAEAQGVIDKIVNWFSELISSIGNLFN